MQSVCVEVRVAAGWWRHCKYEAVLHPGGQKKKKKTQTKKLQNLQLDH